MANAPRKRVGDQLLIRFPEGSDVRDRLEAVARANNRSLSAEVVHRLEMSLKTEPDSAPDNATLAARLDDLTMRFDELKERLDKYER